MKTLDIDYGWMQSVQHNQDVRSALKKIRADEAAALAEKHEQDIKTIKVWSVYLAILLVIWLAALAMGVQFD